MSALQDAFKSIRECVIVVGCWATVVIGCYSVSADNPCIPNWSWSPQPVLGDITTPNADPTCPSWGIKTYDPDWGTDSNGTCVDSQECQSPQTGVLLVSYSWEVKNLTSNVTVATGTNGGQISFAPNGPGLYQIEMEKDGTAETEGCGVWTNSTSATVQFYIFDIVRAEMKRTDEAAVLWATHSGGDVVPGETYDFRALFDFGNGATATSNGVGLTYYYTESGGTAAVGSGSSVSRSIAATGSGSMEFFLDKNNNSAPNSGECTKTVSFNIVNHVTHSVSFNVHANLASVYNSSAISSLLASGNAELQTRDQVDDRRAAVSLSVSSVSTFGTLNGPLKFIDNSSEYNQVKALSGTFKWVMGTIPCGGVDAAGCEEGGQVILGGGADYRTIIHEFGHIQGLNHHNPTHRIISDGAGGPTLSDSDRSAYR